MKKMIAIAATVLLTACGNMKEVDKYNITDKFRSTWNIYEVIVVNDDGSITYTSTPWGGLVAGFKEHNHPVDWSEYGSITFEFAEPTKVQTQITVSNRLKTVGKPGITSLTCYFDGQDVTSISEVGLQTFDSTTVTIKRVMLEPAATTWDSHPIWTGECHFGNWEKGFVIQPEQFSTALAGDKIEFIFTTEPDKNYWLFKTIYNQTDSTLEGNDNELNQYGCAMVGQAATVYRIPLTEKDVKMLQEKGLFVNGYCNIVTQCNLLRKDYVEEQPGKAQEAQEEEEKY